MQALVSLITPVYNAIDSIGRCLSSIMSQTYTELEVIIVDDHGKDGSIDEAHRITDSYDGPINFRYTQTPVNSGPGTARNIGIESATGKYIAFVDGDDAIDTRFCEKLVESAEKNDSDLCCCNLELIDKEGNKAGTRRNPEISDGEFTGERRKNFLSTYVSYFTTFLYRRELFMVNRIHFPSGRSSEDSAMLCCALLCCRRISQVREGLYYYYRQGESLSSKSDALRYRYKLSSLGTLLDIVRENGWYDADKDEIDFIYFKKGYLMAVFDYISNNEPTKLSDIKAICSEIKGKIPDYRRNPYRRSRLVYRWLDVLITRFPRTAIPIIRCYMEKWNKTII